MSVSQKKTFKLLPNGAFYRCFFNSVINKNKLYIFNEKSYTNLPLYLKPQKKLVNLNTIENSLYRKKYFN